MSTKAKFLGLARQTGPNQFKEAQIAIELPVGSDKAAFLPVTDLELLQLIEDASTYLRQKAQANDE